MKRHMWKYFVVAAAMAAAFFVMEPLTAQPPGPGGKGPGGKGPGGGGKGFKGKAKAGPVKRLANGKPDINGYWGQNLNFAAFALEGRTKPDFEVPTTWPTFVVDPPDGKIPYNAAAQAKRKDLFENHLADDPQAHCFLSGVPRQVYTPFGFQILQANDAVLLTFEAFHAYRIVYMGGKHPDPKIRLFEGDSRGHWDGDVLVVDTDNLNNRTWFDMTGNFHGPNLKVVEHFIPVDENTITYRATITEPEIYTRPWTIQFNVERTTDPNFETLEYACVEGEQDLQHYTVSAGGAKQDQK